MESSSQNPVASISKSRRFQDVLVWKKGHEIVLEIYRMSQQLPKVEMYGLTSQIRRAAVSVPANIAEGFKRKGKIEKIRFYNIAQSSLEEVRYFLILIQDLNYEETENIQLMREDMSKMLEKYISSIQQA